MAKSLLEQWQEDCERLSEPEKQWEFKYFVTGGFMQCTDKNSIELLIRDWENKDCWLGDKKQEITRIESLALPFDLEDAMNGGKVEYIDFKGNWLLLENHQFISNIDDMITTVFNYANYVTRILNLRMKESRLKTTGEKHHA